MDGEKLRAATDYIIIQMEDEGLPLNLVKLQRLLYAAYAWHLAFTEGARLFEEHFEAWKFGPVNRAIQERFRDFSSFYSPITRNDRWFSLTSEIDRKLNGEEKEHLDLVLSIYGHMTAFELEEMLREEDPWKIARTGLGLDENSSRQIPDEIILEYYRRRARL